MTTPLHKKLNIMGQEQLLNSPFPLSPAIAAQIDKIDLDIFAQQQTLFHSRHTPTPQAPFGPLSQVDLIGNASDRVEGLKHINQGRVGVLIVAGGQGTRLGFEGPKGLFPISVIRGKTLFQLLAEKCGAASKRAGQALQMAIMTSPQNDQATRAYFQEQNFFGLESDQLAFFCQEQLPLLNEEGNLFLESSDALAEGPDGNGYALKHLARSGILEKWENKGIQYVNFLPIDNPLADPWDPELIGYHHRRQCDAVIKCIRKEDPEEKVGILVNKGNHLSVIEYTELSHEEKYAKNHDGTLMYQLANISLFSFTLPFIKAISATLLPLHLAHKKAKYLKDGLVHISEEPIAWKFETFIFDILAKADAAALLYPKEHCFAPLKNKDGPDSPLTVKAALQKGDRQIWKLITGTEPASFPFELSMDFHYPTDQFLKEWRSQKPIF